MHQAENAQSAQRFPEGHHAPIRAVELLARHAEKSAQAAVIAAVGELGDLPPLGDADLLILLNALACAVLKRPGHAGLVCAIDGWATHLDELMNLERAVDETAICQACNPMRTSAKEST